VLEYPHLLERFSTSSGLNAATHFTANTASSLSFFSLAARSFAVSSLSSPSSLSTARPRGRVTTVVVFFAADTRLFVGVVVVFLLFCLPPPRKRWRAATERRLRRCERGVFLLCFDADDAPPPRRRRRPLFVFDTISFIKIHNTFILNQQRRRRRRRRGLDLRRSGWRSSGTCSSGGASTTWLQTAKTGLSRQ